MLHDVHERIPPIMGVWFAKEVEKYELFFLEEGEDRVTVEMIADRVGIG